MMGPQDTLDPTTGDDQLVARLLEEITQKIEAGQPVDLDAYEREYPQHIERIRRAVPALQVLDELGLSAAKGSRAAGSPQSVPLGGTLGDYRILCEIGRGGMGIVYEAEQISLHRRVALKVLPFAAVLDPRHLQRFKNEAQAAASLKHPNIVGIHSVGCERGVHYYAMEYVEGQTLAEVIAGLRQGSGERDEGRGARGEGSGDRGQGSGERDEGRGARGEGPDASSSIINHKSSILPPHPVTPSPAHAADTSPLALLSTEGSTRSPEFFRTVARLGIQAAEALEHAHQMGVVHRDIKPSNLMVEFPLPSPHRGRGAESPFPSPARGGEAESHLPSPSGRGAGGEGRGGEAPRLWITDFGLARISTPSPLGGEGRGEGASLTMTGDVLGTLRYMSPEQLQAKHGVLDHRTDIYSLGLTLYELLTLQPAFPGDDRQSLIRQIGEDDPRPPRQLNKSTPKDLETIILKATAKEPQSRYATAQALADDLRRFLADEPIRARRPGLPTRAVKWARRHRPVVLSAAVLMLVAMIGLAASTLLISRAYRNQEAERQRAEQNLRLALDAVDQIYLEFATDTVLSTNKDLLPHQKRLTPEAEKFLKKALRFYEQFAEANRGDRSVRYETAKAYARVGNIQSGLGRYHEAVAANRHAVEILKDLFSESPDAREYRRLLAEAQNNLGCSLGDTGDYHGAVAAISQAIELDPWNPNKYSNLGYFHWKLGRNPDAAIAACTQAIRLAPDSALAYLNRADAYGEKGDLDRAIADYNEAIRLAPKWGPPYNNRGDAYERKGDLEKAFADYDDAIRLSPEHEKPLPYANRAKVYLERGQFDKALADFNESIRLIDPNDGRPFNGRAVTYLGKGDFERALADFTEAIRRDPECSLTRSNRGYANLEKGDLHAALADFDKAIQLDPANADAHRGRAHAQRKLGDLDGAVSTYTQAIRVDPDSAGAYTGRAQARAKLGQIGDALTDIAKAAQHEPKTPLRKHKLAWSLATLEDPRLRRVDRALELATAAVQASPDAYIFQTTLGVVHYREGDWKAAAQLLEQASEAEHEHRIAGWFFLAMAHWQLGEKEEARKWYDKAVQWMEKNQPQAPDLRRFRAEAGGLLGIKDEGAGTSEQPE